MVTSSARREKKAAVLELRSAVGNGRMLQPLGVTLAMWGSSARCGWERCATDKLVAVRRTHLPPGSHGCGRENGTATTEGPPARCSYGIWRRSYLVRVSWYS